MQVVWCAGWGEGVERARGGKGEVMDAKHDLLAVLLCELRVRWIVGVGLSKGCFIVTWLGVAQ